MRRVRIALILVALGCAACATGASEPGDRDAVRPNARAGPFRELRPDELSASSGPAPYPLTSSARQFRDPTVLDLERTGQPGEASLYAVAIIAGTSGIYRFVAPDARSFVPEPQPSRPVLEAELPWEGGWVGSPSVHRVRDEVWLLYAAAGGIGLARSDDGIEFEREPGPVLAADVGIDWEGGLPPGGPALLQVSEDDLRLFYSVNGSLGEASSRDGITYQRMGDAPLLEPGGASAYDSAASEEPHALFARSPEGRTITRVYYAALDFAGRRTIGLAARFADSGPLERASSPVLSTTRNPRSPAVVPFDDFALLFVTQQAGVTAGLDFPAIAVGVSPPTVSLALR